VKLGLRKRVPIAAPSILPCGCARERERVSRTPSENLPEIFSKKNFEKIWRLQKNALPLQMLSR